MKTKLYVVFGGLFIFLGMLMLPLKGSAQDVYFSISGKSATVSSGDDIGQYDYWFRPVPGVSNPRQATVEIFDAGLGGFADVVIGDPSTRTSYALYHFDDMYVLRDRSVHERQTPSTQSVIEEIVAFTESRFLNRWVPFFTLSESRDNGFIMRVSTDDGNDVNDFQIRITGPGADDWELITLNLSVGLISSTASNQFQFRPLWGDATPPEMVVNGHEDSVVFLIDAFGESRDLDQGWEDFQRQRYRKENRWGVIMTGSRIRINNRVLRGVDRIVPFYFDPVILSEDDLDEPDIQQIPYDEPTEYGLRASFRGTSLDLNNAEWTIGNQEFTGPEFRHNFGRFGTRDYRVIIPVRGRHFPQYLVMEGNLHINTPPVIEVEGYRPIVSPGETVTLDASDSYDPDGRELEYQWYLNDVFRSSSSSFTFSSSVSGRYLVRLSVSDNAPDSYFTDTTEEFEIVVNTQPYAEIEYKRVIAESSEAIFRAKNAIDADGDELRFTWRLADRDDLVQGKEVRVFHEEPGFYRVFLTVDDQTGTQNARYETDAVYKVNAAPVPVFATPAIVAPNDQITLDASESYDPDDDDLLVRWEISDGRRFEGTLNTIRFSEPGDYTISLSVDDGEGVENSEQKKTRNIRVNESPVPVVQAVSHTNNARVEFDASESHGFDADKVQFIWDFGDDHFAEGRTVTHTYATHGEYRVTLTVDDGAGLSNSVQSVPHDVRINKNPVAIVEAPQVVAPGRSFVLDGRQSYDDDGRIVSYKWLRNGKQIGEGPTLEKELQKPGLHHITLVVRDNSPFDDATGSETVAVRVNHPPVVVWRSDPPVTEPGRRVRFDAAGSYDPDGEPLQFRWAFADGRQLSGETIERTFDDPGEMQFTLFADDGRGLDNSITMVESGIRVNQSPVIVAESTVHSNSLRVTLDASDSYDPDGGELGLTWRLPDGTERNEAAFDWIAPEAGTYQVTLVADDGENMGNSVVGKEIEVMINRPPVVDLPSMMEACTDQHVTFSPGDSYDPDGNPLRMEWDFGDGSTSRDDNPRHAYREPGYYQVTLALRDGIVDQPSVGVMPVYVEGTPQARIAQREMTVCANTAVTFDGSGSFDPNGMVGSYAWDFGGDGSAVGAKATHMFREPGTYEVTLTITGSGSGNCPNTSNETALVHVVAAPQAYFEVPEIVSPGHTISLFAGDSRTDDEVIDYHWEVRSEGEQVLADSGSLRSFTPDSPGVYDVSLTIVTDNQAGCSENIMTKSVRVNDAPVADWNLPDQWPQYQPYRLTAEGTTVSDGYIDSYIWYMNGQEIGRGFSVPLPVDRYGEQDITLVATDDAGVDNSEVRKTGTVYLNPNPEPSFYLSSVAYKGEEIELSPDRETNRAGSPLRSTWYVNGNQLDEPGFTAVNQRYDVVLVQDDGSELPNSSAHVRKTLNVRQPPPLRITLPDAVILGQRLHVSDMNLPDQYVLVQNNSASTDWVGDATGRRTVIIGWKPQREILEEHRLEVNVLERLRARKERLQYRVAYNPVNNAVQVNAPEVNRPENHVLTYEWYSAENDTKVAEGSTAHLPVQEGWNEFELRINEDSRIMGNREVRIPVTIQAE